MRALPGGVVGDPVVRVGCGPSLFVPGPLGVFSVGLVLWWGGRVEDVRVCWHGVSADFAWELSQRPVVDVNFRSFGSGRGECSWQLVATGFVLGEARDAADFAVRSLRGGW